ncbi:MAG: methyl-accepting chemotaxis protein [Bacteroidota bacterium]
MKIDIKNKILLITISGLLIISFFSLYNIISTHYKRLSEHAEASLQKNKETFTNILENDKAKLLVALEVLIRDKNSKDLYLKGNQDSLFTYSTPIFEQLKKKFNITHWYFINKNRTCFLRVHRKNKRNDTINRKTLINSIKTENYSMGLELGSRAFAYRVIYPYYFKDELIGYIEMSEEIGHFSQLMKNQTGDNSVLVIDKKYLNEKKWTKARKEYPEMAKWNEYEDIILINRTTDLIEVNKILPSLVNMPDEGLIIDQNYKINNRSYILGSFPIYDATQQKVGALVYLNDITKLSDKMYFNSISMSSILLLLIIVVVITIIIIIKRSIINPLENAKKYISEISKGNLQTNITIYSKDEIGIMLIDLKKMVTNLTSTMLTISKSINTINITSEKLNSNSIKLEQSNSVQKNSIEKISDEISEISQKIKQSDENAEQTGKYAESSGEKLKQGKSAFIQTTDAMNNIAEKVSIISEIALQTNIIALNAAIEAARAGEYGKGFSVVAVEVKKLAEISKNSADTINQLSSSSIDIAEKSKYILDEIIQQMNKTTTMINEISLASMEQTNSINHVNDAISSLYNLSQQIVSFSTESSDIAKDLNKQAHEMLKVVSSFNFGK